MYKIIQNNNNIDQQPECGKPYGILLKDNIRRYAPVMYTRNVWNDEKGNFVAYHQNVKEYWLIEPEPTCAEYQFLVWRKSNRHNWNVYLSCPTSESKECYRHRSMFGMDVYYKEYQRGMFNLVIDNPRGNRSNIPNSFKSNTEVQVLS